MTATEEAPAGPADAAEARVGTCVDGRYALDAILGRGGMGVVYAGRHVGIGKPVALKVLHPHRARDEGALTRFLKEARAASAAGSPHIVDVTDYGTLEGGTAYLVMELLEGESLARRLASRGRLPLAEVVAVGVQLARGLAAAHAAGIVHRDLKPDNVMLVPHGGPGEELVKIVDFGIAKVDAAGDDGVAGTPHYMAPEQAAGGETDGRTDVYAVGVMLYELATGTRPFDAETPLGVLARHAHGDYVPASERQRELPRAFDGVLARCLAKDPARRWPTATALEEALLVVVAPKRSRRRWVPVALVTLAAGVALGARGAPKPTAPVMQRATLSPSEAGANTSTVAVAPALVASSPRSAAAARPSASPSAPAPSARPRPAAPSARPPPAAPKAKDRPAAADDLGDPWR